MGGNRCDLEQVEPPNPYIVGEGDELNKLYIVLHQYQAITAFFRICSLQNCLMTFYIVITPMEKWTNYYGLMASNAAQI